MQLFEFVNGAIGESYVRCYAIAADRAAALESVIAKHGDGKWQCDLILADVNKPCVSMLSDCGFFMNRN